MRFYSRRRRYSSLYRPRYKKYRKYRQTTVRTRVVYKTDYYKLKGLKRKIYKLKDELRKQKALSNLFASELSPELEGLPASMNNQTDAQMDAEEDVGMHVETDEAGRKRVRLGE